MKQVILIRQDLKLPRGKLAVQVGHASVEAALGSSAEKVRKWREDGSKKIVLKVQDEKELISFQRKAKALGLKATLIRDAGRTVVKPGTITALAIGPDEEDKIDKLTGSLKMV